MAAPRLLSGGNPQIPKGDGDAPVRAWIAAAPGWKGETSRELDALIAGVVPGVVRAVRWNSPFYGVRDRGFFLNVHCFNRFVRVTFFRGAALRPLPPGSGKDPDARWADVLEGPLDRPEMEEWVRQAAALPGWRIAGQR